MQLGAELGSDVINVPEIIEGLGGGPGSIMVGMLVVAVIALWRHSVKLSANSRDDQKEHTAQIMDAMQTVTKAIDFVERSKK